MRPLLLRPPVFDFGAMSALCGLPLCKPGVFTATVNLRPGDDGFALCSDMIYSRIPGSGSVGAEEVDLAARSKLHIGFFPRRTPAGVPAMTLDLAADVQHGDILDLDLEQQFDCLPNLRLGCVCSCLGQDLVTLAGDGRAFFRKGRHVNHVHQPFLVLGCTRDRRSSLSFSAGRVTSTFSNRINTTGSIEDASHIPTSGRLRAERNTFSSNASLTINTLFRPSSFSLPANSFVFGASIASDSVTTSRSCRMSSDSTDLRAPRYILRLTF